MGIRFSCQCGQPLEADESMAGSVATCPGCGREIAIEKPPSGSHEVFISYSSEDKSVADAVCATLENHRLRCWVAPRDVLPGMNWGETIIDAIQGSRVLVLVLSAHANRSPHVMREVERAVSNGIPVIPFRIEAVHLSKSMEYLISTPHWLDALTPPLARHLEKLARTVAVLVDHKDGRSAAAPPDHRPPAAEAGRSVPASTGRWKRRMGMVAAVAVLAVLGAVVPGVMKRPSRRPPTARPVPAPLQGATAATVETKPSRREEAARAGVGRPVASEPSAGRSSRERTLDLGDGVKLELVHIEPGSFMMGSPPDEPGRDSRDATERQHHVTLTRGFWLGKYEVTQGQWRQVTGKTVRHQRDLGFATNPLFGEGDDYPMYYITWTECQDFLGKLNMRTSGRPFRMPTEAEWEYACRAGTTGPYAGNLDEMGWYGNNSGRVKLDAERIFKADPAMYVTILMNNGCSIHPVGMKDPNPWGLHDMHGNVSEWCQDWYGDYPVDSVTDPAGPESGLLHVSRGGSWNDEAKRCRSARRNRADSGYRFLIGLRLVMME